MADRTHGYAFVDAAFDRASERREDEAWLSSQLESDAAIFIAVRGDGTVLVDAAAAQLAAFEPDRSADAPTLSFLGLSNQRPTFALLWPADREPTEERHRFLDLRSIAQSFAADQAGLAAYARALLHWQSRKRYCGRCGAPTRFSAGGHRAECSDARCAQVYFPRTDPAIIVIVTDGERCLLGRQASWPPKRFSALAGFVEPGETLENAVRREVLEESGIRVGTVDYLGSQPWPFPASLMLGFIAQANSTEIAIGAELEDARWFSPADIDQAVADGDLILSPTLSISHYLLAHWYREKTGRELPRSAPRAPR